MMKLRVFATLKPKISDAQGDSLAATLRSLGFDKLAEHGCTDAEIMAISGHQTRAEVTRYRKGADQKRNATAALAKLAKAA
jgi:phosphoribosylformylglycinamidine (FGAM) synthase PurS component